MTGFVLKILAVITMILDHIKYGVPITKCFVTKYFGRLSFPLFAFLIAEGLIHTKNRKKYIIRMTIFALVSQIPFMLFRTLVMDKFLFDIMFTFLFAIIGICGFEFLESKKKIPSILKFILTSVLAISILFIGMAIPVDYGWFGISTVWLFYLLRDKKMLRTFMYIILVILYYASVNISNLKNINYLSVIFTILPIFIILLYNGKEGKKIKFFFYLFYPIHMLIIYGLSFICL